MSLGDLADEFASIQAVFATFVRLGVLCGKDFDFPTARSTAFTQSPQRRRKGRNENRCGE
jgi:hypothetical protein